MRSANYFLLGLLVSGIVSVPGVSQNSSNPNNQQSTDQSAVGGRQGRALNDQQFLKKAANDDLAEVKMAELAQQKSSNSGVKDVAQKLMTDHQQNLQQLQQVAQQQSVTLPTQPDAKDQAKYDQLSKLSGAEFDKAYIREQLRGHKHDIAMFERAQAHAQNAALKSYASQTLPTLQQHLQMVQSAAQQQGMKMRGDQETASTNQHQ